MEPGKYQGRHLSTQEVQRLYAAGERNFRGAILRGSNFCRIDLSQADFSGADICGTRFVDATLREAKFCGSRAGLRRRATAVQLILVSMTTALAGILQGVSGTWIGYLLTTGYLEDFVAAILSMVVIAATLFAIVRQGFTNKALGSVAVAGAAAGAIAGAFAIAGAVTAINVISGASAVAGAFAGAIAGTVTVAFAVVISVIVGRTVAGVITVMLAVFSAVAFAGTVAGSVSGATAGAAAVASANFLIPIYLIRRLDEGDAKFENLRIISLIFTALGGTNFSGADLTDATFAHAHLSSTSFANSRQRPTILTHVRWHHAEKLDRARLDTSNLQDARVCTLLSTLNGVGQDFSHANLQGVNLTGAHLYRANFGWANLNDATLAAAELQDAVFTGAQCVGTDFTAAQLTGACLEAWNIDSTTTLHNIDCQYVFLREEPDSRGNRERRPHNPDKDFQPGDFEKIFKEMLDTVQILIRNGVDPGAFRTAFERVMAENPEISREGIQRMERQGADVLLTLQVAPGTDKAKVERTWDEGYQLGLKAGYTSGLLEGQTQRADDVKEVALGLGKLLSSIQITNMNNPINTGDGSFYAGGDVNLSGSTLNLGQISGQVTNQINQIPAGADRQQPNLRDILTQLKTAIDSERELSDTEKAEALQAVARIAAAATDPAPSEKTQGVVKRATTTLKGMAETLTDTSTLADACTKLLPVVLSLFALI